ncbi:hypothetical protein [Myroides odoratus]|uniref:hypothetical protein n=1 Tax=Myroides odoratus TaxID=256 RepID=UPI00333F06BA
MNGLRYRNIIILLFLFIASKSFSKTVDATVWGAKGDNKTNNTEVFIKILGNIIDNDTLFLPKGDYIIDGLQIKDKKNFIIVGEGRLIASNAKNQDYFITIRNCPNIKISGISLNCNNLRNVALDIYESPNGHLSDMIVENVMGKDNNWASGIIIRQKNHFFCIDNIKVDKVSSQQNAAIGIWMFLQLNQEESKNVNILNVEILNINSPSDGDGIKVQQLQKNSYLLIKDCTFVNTSKRAIKIQTNEVKIENNFIKRTSEYGDGFSVFSVYGSNIEIIGNDFRSFGNSSVNMFVDISAVSNVLIKNNRHFISNESKSKVKDFVLTKYHKSEKNFVTQNVRIEGNTVNNIRNFFRVKSNLISCELINNNITNLNSNFILIANDTMLTSVDFIKTNNKIAYTKHSYTELYSPKHVKINRN